MPRARSAAGAEPREVRLQPFTNVRKVFWPDDGYTKGALVAYCDAMAPIMLPSLRGRPFATMRNYLRRYISLMRLGRDS